MDLYKNLDKISQFQESFSNENFALVPSEWNVVITDIKGSTAAIREGRYKEVNIAGGLSVVALANAFHDMEFPFIFGGDGVTFLIPPGLISDACDILMDTKEKVRELYDLDLRIGVVPVRDLLNDGKTLQLAKLAVSQYYDQAIISGTAVDTAEAWVKKADSPYLVKNKKNDQLHASFIGFTCRWQDVISSEGETIALIVKVREGEVSDPVEYYQYIASEILKIAGDESKYHPVKSQYMKMAGADYLGNEARAISGKKSGFRFLLQKARIFLELIATGIIMQFRLPMKMGFYDLKDLRNYNTISSDYRKFDGTLKMVLSVPEIRRVQLQEFLEKQAAARKIFYGLHISDRAILTCLLHVDSEREVHFVDAADGGYALAAQQMKEQIRSNDNP